VKRLIIYLVLLLFDMKEAGAQIPPPTSAPTAVPTFKLFLIGDAGEGDTTGATLGDLRVKLLQNPNSAVIFLGDNCYIRSLHGLLKVEAGGFDGSKRAQNRLMSQLSILREYKGYAYFVPGNHDWYNRINLKAGKKHLAREEKFIEDTLGTFKSLKNDGETFIPSNGEPGPVLRTFNEGRTAVIFIDTYRLIIEEANRDEKNEPLLTAFYSKLHEMLKEATRKKQKIIVAAHHPIHAKGKHSQVMAMWQSMVRRFANSNTNYPPYNRMAKQLDSLLKAHNRPDIYYVSGHEHSLEYFFNDSLHYIVSGAGSRIDQVDYKETDNPNEYFIWNEEGYFEIQFFGKFERVLIHHRKSNDSEIKVHCIAGCE
jgi:hypothetical protein